MAFETHVDTGLMQQLRTVNPSLLREVPGTDQQGADACR